MTEKKITLGDTPARRRGWAILKAQQAEGKLARESNISDEKVGYIYWQVCRWLVEQGVGYYPSGSTMMALTQLGRDYVAKGF